MRVTPLTNSKIPFGVKVKTSDVIGLISGENFHVASNLDSQFDPKSALIFALTNNDEISFLQKNISIYREVVKYCTEKIVAENDAFKPLAKLRESLTKSISNFEEGVSSDATILNDLAEKRTTEATRLLTNLPEFIDIEPINISKQLLA